jgi:hypothetical protein
LNEEYAPKKEKATSFTKVFPKEKKKPKYFHK